MDIMNLLDELGKTCNVGSKTVGPTVLSALTDVQIGGSTYLFDFPSDAKTLIAAAIHFTSPAGNTANEPVVAKCTLQSQDTGFRLGDCTFLANPIGSSLAKGVTAPQGSMKEALYPLFAPIPDSGQLKILGTGLFDHTIEPYLGVQLWFCDIPLTYPQRHYKLGTFTNTGTAAAPATDTTILRFTGGKRIVEVGGLAVGTTVATLKGLTVKMALISSDIIAYGQIEYFLESASGMVDTNISEFIPRITRWPVSVGVKTPCNLTVTATLNVALTTTGNFIAQIAYI